MNKQQTEPNILGDPIHLDWQDLDTAQNIRWDRWMTYFITLGLVARTLRYVLRFPLWDDETFLCVSFYQCGFRELLEPLTRHQVAPFLFLWLEKAMVLLFGFNELSLRFIPFLVSIASVFLFAHLVKRLIAGPAQVFCMAWFAVSYPGIRYTAEAKQYATDMFASLILIMFTVEWLRRPRQKKWFWALILWCPIAICLSLPGIFTAAGMSLLLLFAMWRSPQARSWGHWITYNLMLLASLGLVYIISLKPQMQQELGFMTSCWDSGFVPFDSITHLLKWIVTAHTGILFAHPAGDDNFGSSLTTILCVTGIIVLFWKKRPIAALLFLMPLLMHLGAAAVRKYPYGGHFKFSMYIAPMIYLTMGFGTAALFKIRSTQKSAQELKIGVTIVLGLISLIGLGSIVRDTLHPYKTTADMRQRSLARWLWHDGNFEGKTVCIKNDLGVTFSEKTWKGLGWSAMYECNKYIYDPQTMIREPRPLHAPTPETNLLRCVLYKDTGCGDFDQAALDTWLADMKQSHEYLGVDTYPVPRHDKKNRYLVQIDYLYIYKFKLEE